MRGKSKETLRKTFFNGERRAQGARCLCTGENSGMNVPGAEIAGVKVLRQNSFDLFMGYGSLRTQCS